MTLYAVFMTPTLYTHGMSNENPDQDKLRHCPLCGCTEHRLIGCHRHKETHVKGPDGRCIVKS